MALQPGRKNSGIVLAVEREWQGKIEISKNRVLLAGKDVVISREIKRKQEMCHSNGPAVSMWVSASDRILLRALGQGMVTVSRG